MQNATRLHNAAIYDHLSESTRKTIESLLLVCLANETTESVRNKIVDTVTDIAEGSMARARESHNSLFLDQIETHNFFRPHLKSRRTMARAPGVRC